MAVLLQNAHLIQRPANKNRFPVNIAAGDHAPGPAVVGRTAVIAEDEIFVGRNGSGNHRTLVAILRWNIVLNQRLTIHDHVAMVYFYAIAWNGDDALDIRLARIAWKPENHCVAAIHISEVEPVSELVDENAFLVVERGHHA